MLGFITSAALLWVVSEGLQGRLSEALGIVAIFVGGFVGMLVAGRRLILYALILGTLPLTAIFVGLAVQHGDPVIYALATNLWQIAMTFIVVLAGAATACVLDKRRSAGSRSKHS